MRRSGVKEGRISRAGGSFTHAGKPGQRRMRLLRSVLADGCDRRCGVGFGQNADLCERCADNLGALRAGEGSVTAGIQPRIQKRRPVLCTYLGPYDLLRVAKFDLERMYRHRAPDEQRGV
jgi:hypothetical protein